MTDNNKKLIIFKDGDNYCITGENFINLQESDALFIHETSSVGIVFKRAMEELNEV